MSERRRRLAVMLCLGSALLVAVLGVLVALVLTGPSTTLASSSSTRAADLATAFTFAGVGAFLALKRPGNLVGWALSLAGVGLLLGHALRTYAELALLVRPEADLPGGAAAVKIAGGYWTAMLAGTFLLLLLYPGGRLPAPRWRWPVRVVLAAFAILWVAPVLMEERLDPPFDRFVNPLALGHGDRNIAVLYPLVVVGLVAVGLAAASLLVRFRRSSGAERQQFRWLAASGALLLVTFPTMLLWAPAGAGFVIAMIALPVSVGIAVLRYRLYEIDRIVSRTVVYGAVTALLTGVYFAVVLALQGALGSAARGNDLLIAASTLVAAALFRPVRGRVQALVDRRFNRRRYDAEQTIVAFAHHLRDQVDLDRLAHDLAHVVHDTMRPAHVSLWLRSDPSRNDPGTVGEYNGS